MLLPTSKTERFNSLDLIRGVAILGILVMNIYAFGHPFAYYMNPLVYGDVTSLDLLTWNITHIIADQKFYTIFSILFGAGIMLMAEKATIKKQSAGRIHYRRMGWLLMFGVLHGFFIWYGDILATYAVTGLWVYLFALKSTAKTKIIIGSILITLLSVFIWLIYLVLPYMPDDVLQEMVQMTSPSQQEIDKTKEIYHGSWLSQFEHRTDFYSNFLLESLFFFAPFRIGGGMLIGMALYQLKILTAQKSNQFYLIFSLVNLLIGYTLSIYSVQQYHLHNFDAIYIQLQGFHYNYFGSFFVALGYIGLLCLWSKGNALMWLRSRFEAVGQMAFTNYIAQSVICTFVFYSYGLDLFAKLERYQLFYVVIIVFLLQLAWSKYWLQKYHFGPLEWLWRKLTYGNYGKSIEKNS